MGANKRNQKKFKQPPPQKYTISKPLTKAPTSFQGSFGSKYKSDIDALRPILREEGLYLKEIVADGNCLFRAFSFFMERGNQESHPKYRREVSLYIKKHKEEYQCIFDGESELNDYIAMIERDRTWGGELEMSILSKQYQCAFVIHANGRPNIAVDSCEHIANKQVFHLAYHLGEHYNCVLTLDQLGNVDEQPSAPNVPTQYETPQSSWWYWIMTILSLIGPYLYMNYYK